MPDTHIEQLPVNTAEAGFRGWKILGVHLSTIACAVHVVPTAHATSGEGARENLRVLLERIVLNLCNLGFSRPVIGIIQESSAPFTEWPSDQAWHQGRFAVFVEIDEVSARRRITELLAPIAPAWHGYRPHSVRSEKEVVGIVRNRGRVSADLGNIFSEKKWTADRLVEWRADLNKWLDRMNREADRLIEGDEDDR